MSFAFGVAAATARKELPLLRDYEINFEENCLTGRIVEGKAAVKQWIHKALKTGRYRQTIYSWDYGHELDELTERGFGLELIKSEAERYVREALSVSEYITGIKDFKADIQGDKLFISFTANTVYGAAEIVR